MISNSQETAATGGGYSIEGARDKNRDEYNKGADAYTLWQETNVLMQHQCYYTAINELQQEGIEGKTFLEVGCGPCPMGQKLVPLGAKKIYGLDISQSMIDNANQELTKKGIIDKFELICADIFDESFQLPEKVDGVICGYTISTFINTYEMLTTILKRMGAQTKPDGFIFISDFQWVDQPCEDWFYGMYTKTKEEGKLPAPFEPFNFQIDKDPEMSYDIFNIPAEIMFKAAWDAGFNDIMWKKAYLEPGYEKNEVCRKYIDVCKSPDYVMKLKVKSI